MATMTEKEIKNKLEIFETALRGRLKPNTIAMYIHVAHRLLDGTLNPTTIKTRSRRAQANAVKEWLLLFSLITQAEAEQLHVPTIRKVAKTNPRLIAYRKKVEKSDFLRYLAILPKTKKGQQLHFISRLCYHSGFRLSEVFKIRPSDISFNDQSDRWVVVIEGKGGVVRQIPIQKEDINELKISVPLPDIYSYARNMTRRYLEKIGVKSSIHGFRHSCATNMVNHGVPIQDVKEILGHASIDITEIYVEARGANSPALSKEGF